MAGLKSLVKDTALYGLSTCRIRRIWGCHQRICLGGVDYGTVDVRDGDRFLPFCQ